MTKTVTISALRADSTPYAHHKVIVTLVAGTAGGVVGSNVVVSSQTVPLDANGAGSVVLYTNDVEITSPTTSFYRFTVEGSSPTITRSIRVTDALPSTISWTRSGIEVGDPTTPDRDVAAEYVRMANGQSLPNYLDDLPSGGGGADHTVAAFADDFAADGSFTTVPLLPGGDIPRAFLTGATVLVVTGDNLGLWTIPASGPATAGTALAPGDVIASQSGRMAVAQTADGTTLSGVRLQADVPYVSTIETALAGDIDTVGNGLAAEITNRGTAVTNEANARIAGDAALAVANTASLTRQRMAEQAERVDAPTKWAVCGTAGSVWEADFQIPGATSTLAIETLVRIVGPAREPGFVEVIAESLDGAGAWDRYETALWLQDVNTDDVIEAAVSFAEGTAVGDSVEWQRVPGGQQDNGATAPTAIGPWVRYLWVYDFTAHTITTYYEDDVYWDYEFHDIKWATIGVYTNPAIDSLHATNGYDTWIGRSIAEYHQAQTHVWVDGTEVLLFDPSTAAIGAASIFDSVAVDGSDDPIEWVGTADSVVGGVASGAVASVNGETGTVVLDATDVGAQPADSDLTAIAALTTTSFGRSLLTQADAAATLAAIGAASNAAVPFKAQVGDWVSQPHDGIFAATQTLNRLTYVPWLVPAGFAQTDGIAVEVTTVATSALCRLGIYLPHATTGRPGALVIDGGTVDFSSGGGAAGIRTLTITATNLTPGSLIYVAVVPQGATAAARHINSGEVLRSYGYASSTVADVFRANGASAYYEGSVTGALPVNATPLIGNIVGQPLVALRRSA